jgi:hypothetical protein
MLTIELMPTLLKLSRLSIRRASRASRQAKERKLIDQLESHVRSSYRSKAIVLCISQTNNIYTRRIKRKKKWQLIEIKREKKKDVRTGSIYIYSVYNLFDVSMNAMWINRIPWNKQAESNSLSLSHTHTQTGIHLFLFIAHRYLLISFMF